MLLREAAWVVIEASHTVSSGLNVTCHMLMSIHKITSVAFIGVHVSMYLLNQ